MGLGHLRRTRFGKRQGFLALESVDNWKIKSRFKYEVRQLKRRGKYVRKEKLTALLTFRNKSNLWKEVKRAKGLSCSASHPVINGLMDNKEILHVFKKININS